MKEKSCHKQINVSFSSSRHQWIAGFFAIGLLTLLVIGPPTAQAQTYSLTDLGVVYGMKTAEPVAINNSGQVAGTSSAGTEACAFLYNNGVMEDIGGIGSRAFGIGSSGLVVGDSNFQAPFGAFTHAALFKGGTAYDLGVLQGGECSRANGINALNQVVGSSGPIRDSDNTRAFVWSSTDGMIDIGTLGGPYAQALAVNDLGFVTGTSQVRERQIGATHAFLYRIPGPGEGLIKPTIDLGTLGGSSSYGTSLNDANHVVGYSLINTIDERFHAFVFNGKKMIDLGTLGGKMRKADYSVALGINKLDQIVGYTYVPVSAGNVTEAKQVAFIYNFASGAPPAMVDLNRLIGSEAKGYWLFSATGINDKGQIVAGAYRFDDGTAHAVLLTPIAAGWLPNSGPTDGGTR